MPVRRTQNWLPSIFNDFFDNEWMEKANATAPAINVLETEKEYKVELAAPGMTKDDFNVHIDEDNNLVISMEKKTENKEEKKDGRYLRREFSYSKFQQTMILPDFFCEKLPVFFISPDVFILLYALLSGNDWSAICVPVRHRVSGKHKQGQKLRQRSVSYKEGLR